jgi:hypothetical protein
MEDHEMKPWFKSKTIWANVGIFFGSVAGYLGQGISLETAILLGLASALGIGLRTITDAPLGTPE